MTNQNQDALLEATPPVYVFGLDPNQEPPRQNDDDAAVDINKETWEEAEQKTEEEWQETQETTEPENEAYVAGKDFIHEDDFNSDDDAAEQSAEEVEEDGEAD